MNITNNTVNIDNINIYNNISISLQYFSKC